MKILHLTLKRKWFLEIAQGYKTIEYRQAKPYWWSRLVGKAFDEVHFRNGYRTDAPFMRVEYGCTNLIIKDGYYVFAIELGSVLEVTNINLAAFADARLMAISVGIKQTDYVSEFIMPKEGKEYEFKV